MKTWRYILSLNDASPQIVTPILDDAQTFEWEKESDQVFLRQKLSGKELIFCNDDFDIINNAAFETKFTIDKALLNDSGTYEVKFIGVFYKTDCSFDLDAKQVTVQPQPSDNYKKLIEGLDKEFNLIDLAPPTVELDYQLQPLFQVYRLGSNVLTSVLSGNYFEQEIINTPTGSTELISTYFFGFLGVHGVVLGDALNPDVGGEYIDETGLLFTDPAKGWIRKDGVYRVRFDNLTDPDADMIIERVSDNVEMYRGAHADGQDYDTVNYISALDGSTARFIYRTYFGRFLTNQETVNATATSVIPESDIIAPTANYTRVIGIGSLGTTGTAGTNFEDVIIAGSDHSSTSDRWGKISSSATFFASEYFNHPTGNGTGAIYPLDRANWSQASFWWQYDSVLRDFQESGSETKTQFNAYKLVDAIQSVLTALHTGLTFAETTDCSKFLFDLSNPINTDSTTPVIVPKSNIIVGEYGEPAKRTPVKLSDLLGLLYGFYKCNWHIEGLNFVLESDQYYHQGKSYTANNVGTNLTTLTESKTGKNWSFGANKWSYDKSKIPGQIRFSWMDKGSEVFDGFPIEMNSEFADQGNIEEIQITRFTSDIDYIQLSPENVSKDGFFFGEAVLVSDRLTLPFVTLDLGNTGEYKVQNGYASLIYAHDKYHRYVLPTSSVNINLENVTAESVKRTKIQEIELPGDSVSGDNIMLLVSTNLGDGQIRSLTENTNGSGSKLVIEHDI